MNRTEALRKLCLCNPAARKMLLRRGVDDFGIARLLADGQQLESCLRMGARLSPEEVHILLTPIVTDAEDPGPTENDVAAIQMAYLD